MEDVYATLLLYESNKELNETNLTAVLEAAGCTVVESRVKALVAALEGVDLDAIAIDAVDRLNDDDGGAPSEQNVASERPNGASEPSDPDPRTPAAGRDDSTDPHGDLSDGGT